MQFEQDNSIERAGEKAGYLASYFLFTSALFGMLYFLDKLPSRYPYLFIMGLTFIIVLTGLIIRWLLS